MKSVEELLYLSLTKQTNQWRQVDLGRKEQDSKILVLYHSDLKVTINTGNRFYMGAFIDYDIDTSLKNTSYYRCKLPFLWAVKFRRYWKKVLKMTEPMKRERLEREILADSLKSHFKPANTMFGGKIIK